MNKVFVLYQEIPYDGCETVGAFSTIEKAHAKAKELAEEKVAYMKDSVELVTVFDDQWEVWAEGNDIFAYYPVEQLEVA